MMKEDTNVDNGASPLALEVRFHGVQASEAFSARAQERLDRKLGRFARHIARVTVRVEDDNGPKGGVDMVCRIQIVLRAAPVVIAEARAADVYAAFDAALKSATGAVEAAHDRAVRPG